MKEVKGASEPVISFYNVEDKVLTVFSLSEEASTSALNIKFIKNFLNIDLDYMSPKKGTDRILDQLNAEKSSNS